MAGAVERVRPKIMTVTAIIAGLLPILWSHGTGSELMQRIAVPMIGGMVSSTVLTLIVIPAVYGLVKGWGLDFEIDEQELLIIEEGVSFESSSALASHAPFLARPLMGNRVSGMRGGRVRDGMRAHGAPGQALST